MPEPTETYQDTSGAFFSDLNVKLRDIEEKQNLIKDRLLLIGENLVSEKEETEAEVNTLKKRVSSLEAEIKKIKLVIQRLIEAQDNFARRTDLNILRKQFEMFQPLELARMKDVEALIKEALKQKK